MEIAVPQDAATVMLMRQAESGLEIYLTRRVDDLRFMGGFYVFPGGKVDREDGEAEIIERCRGLQRLGLDADDSDRLAFYIAACRELFEESGVLPACDSSGRNAGDLARQGSLDLQTARDQLNEGRPFTDILNELDMFLTLDSLVYFDRWVTPRPSPIRFDARFFAAVLPSGFTPTVSPREADLDCWLTPAEALEGASSGRLPMIAPNIAAIRGVLKYRDFKAWASSINGNHPKMI